MMALIEFLVLKLLETFSEVILKGLIRINRLMFQELFSYPEEFLSATPNRSGELLSSSPHRSGLTYSPQASWLEAINSNLSNQKLYNNIVKEILNGLTRAFSWLVLSLVSL